MSNGTNTASASLLLESKTDTFPSPPFSAMCVSSFSPVQPGSTEELRTWLQRAFPASPSASQEGKERKTTNETCGQQPLMSFAWYDPSSRCLKMSQESLLLDIAKPSSVTWPRSGSMRNGECFQLPEREPPTKEKDYSLLPTIGANEFKGASRDRYVGSDAYRGAKMVEGLRTGPDDPIYLNPLFGEWAMGWPSQWTDLKPLETDKFQQWLQRHGRSSHED